jgi:hypothetical protein
MVARHSVSAPPHREKLSEKQIGRGSREPRRKFLREEKVRYFFFLVAFLTAFFTAFLTVFFLAAM